MKLADIKPPSPHHHSKQHKFTRIGHLARLWDDEKHSRDFDDIVATFKSKYDINVSYDMSGIAFHGILFDAPMEKINDMIDEFEDDDEFEGDEDVRGF